VANLAGPWNRAIAELEKLIDNTPIDRDLTRDIAKAMTQAALRVQLAAKAGGK
jgi:hypothetical protein